MLNTGQPKAARVHFERIAPILCVGDIAASVCFYGDVLGFENASWGNEDFTYVSRDGCGIYLCRGGQGTPGAWVWIGVEDVDQLYDQYKSGHVTVCLPPTNYPWAREMQIQDPDGNVLRLGSDPKL